MKEKPYFSLFGPAIRPHFYEDAYNSVAANTDIPFEMVFVGYEPPTKTMPDNFRYIYSEACPAECWDMAARESKADLLISTADDLRYSKNFLNRAYHYTTVLDLNKTLIAFRYFIQWGVSYQGVSVDGGMFYDQGVPLSTVLGASGIFRKDLWVKLGGLDKRFSGSFADIDLTLRFYNELRMSIFIPPDCSLIELDLPPAVMGSNLLHRSNPRPLLDSLWVRDGKFSTKRLLPVESFV